MCFVSTLYFFVIVYVHYPLPHLSAGGEKENLCSGYYDTVRTEQSTPSDKRQKPESMIELRLTVVVKSISVN